MADHRSDGSSDDGLSVDFCHLYLMSIALAVENSSSMEWAIVRLALQGAAKFLKHTSQLLILPRLNEGPPHHDGVKSFLHYPLWVASRKLC